MIINLYDILFIQMRDKSPLNCQNVSYAAKRPLDSIPQTDWTGNFIIKLSMKLNAQTTSAQHKLIRIPRFITP